MRIIRRCEMRSYSIVAKAKKTPSDQHRADILMQVHDYISRSYKGKAWMCCNSKLEIQRLKEHQRSITSLEFTTSQPTKRVANYSSDEVVQASI